MKVTVLNYNAFWEMRELNEINDDTVENYSDTIFISIVDSGSSWFSKRQFHGEHPNVLTLVFDDVLHDGQPSPTNLINTVSFTDEDAKGMVSFLEENKNADFCIVHCAAGISRSGAIGQFVNDFFKEDYHDFKRRNPQISPNEMIVRKLNNAMR